MFGFNPSQQRFKVIKATLFVISLLPFVRLVVSGVMNGLGANPIEFVTRSTGDWTLYFLCMTIAITPLRRIFQWNWLLKLRRQFGLFTFFYAVLHFTTFFWFDHFFDLGEMWKDVLKRPFITIGFTAFVLLIPLAVTSTNKMVRRLGKRWQLLHKLVYVIAPLAIIHFWWMKAGKHNFEQPIIFGLLVIALLLFRVVINRYPNWLGRR